MSRRALVLAWLVLAFLVGYLVLDQGIVGGLIAVLAWLGGWVSSDLVKRG